jgi:Flp pilus assembly CpaE family ATPase
MTPFVTYWDSETDRREAVLTRLRGAGLAVRTAEAPPTASDEAGVWLVGVRDLSASLNDIARFAAQRPTLVLWADDQPAACLAAVRAGALDVVPDAEEALPALLRALSRLAPAAPRRTPTIAVCAPKGGVGKSFLTANLAVALHRLTGRPTTVLDVAMPAGHQAMYFDLQPAATVCDVIALGATEPEVVRQAAGRHASGVRVLAGPAMSRTEAIARHDVRPLIAALGHDDGLVVADVGSFLGECHMGLLAQAELILVPVSPHIGSLSALPATLQALASLGVAPERLVPVFNQAHPVGRPLDGRALAELTQGRAARRVPWGGAAVSRSIDDGAPLVWTHPRHGVSRAIAALAAEAAATLALTPQRKPALRISWLSGRPAPQGGLAHVSS